MHIVGQAHTMLHEKGIVRVQTDIRVGSRYGMISRVSPLITAHLDTGRIKRSISKRKSRQWPNY